MILVTLGSSSQLGSRDIGYLGAGFRLFGNLQKVFQADSCAGHISISKIIEYFVFKNKLKINYNISNCKFMKDLCHYIIN